MPAGLYLVRILAGSTLQTDASALRAGNTCFVRMSDANWRANPSAGQRLWALTPGLSLDGHRVICHLSETAGDPVELVVTGRPVSFSSANERENKQSGDEAKSDCPAAQMLCKDVGAKKQSTT